MTKVKIIKHNDEEVEISVPAYFKYSSKEIIRIESASNATQVIAHSPDNICMVRHTMKAVVAEFLKLEKVSVHEWDNVIALFKEYSEDFTATEFVFSREGVEA